ITSATEAAQFEVMAAYHARRVARPRRGDLDIEHRIWVVARKGIGMDDWEQVAWSGGRALAARCAPGSQVLLADGNMIDLLKAAADGLRFEPLAAPADSAEALARVEALRAAGARWLFVGKHHFWWLDDYPALFERYPPVERTADYLIAPLADAGS